MNSLRLVSSSSGTKLVYIVNGVVSISKVFKLSYIRRLLRRMITISNDCEPESDSLCSYLVFNLFDNGHDS